MLCLRINIDNPRMLVCASNTNLYVQEVLNWLRREEIPTEETAIDPEVERLLNELLSPC